MSEPAGVQSFVLQVLAGKAPERVRSAAARGALPLPRAVLVRLYVHLLEDPEEAIRAAAEDSLRALTADAVRECLAEPDCDPTVLAHFTTLGLKDVSIAERIVFHPATPENSLGTLAKSGNNSVVELVLTNQEKLLAHPSLLERLMTNATLRADQRGRILELLSRAAELQAAERDKPASNSDDPAAAGEESVEVEELASLLEVDVGELLSASEIIDGEEFEQSPEQEIRDAYRRIVTLNTAQKAILAMKGGREERQILIRDSNRTVALGVLKNPRVTDAEVESIAKMRNVCEDVLRVVGGKRDWTKHYPVVVSLINNPRTPQTVTANFIPRLNNRDLKQLTRNRDVPELIRRMARRTHELRTKPQTGSFRKKG